MEGNCKDEPRIEELTPKQEELLAVYGSSWLQTELSIDSHDREESERAIGLAYRELNFLEPEFVWFESPIHAGIGYAALRLNWSTTWCSINVKNPTRNSVKQSVESSLGDVIPAQNTTIGKSIVRSVCEPIWHSTDTFVNSKISRSVSYKIQDSIRDFIIGVGVRQSVFNLAWEWFRGLPYEIFSLEDALYGSMDSCRLGDYDYLHQVLGLDCSMLNFWWNCARNCGWFFPCKEICFVSPRPRAVCIHRNRFDEPVLHALGRAAIEYCSDVQVFAYDGTIIPGSYGRIHPKDWDPKWLLTETNSELRRVLIQGIGYERVCTSLDARIVDSWREYEIVEIKAEIDIEPIRLLNMRCPSTGSLFTLRIPPEIASAREGIAWCNWGVDPEDFAIAT